MTGDWTRKSQGGEELGGDRQTLEVSNGKIKTKKAKNITFDAVSPVFQGENHT